MKKILTVGHIGSGFSIASRMLLDKSNDIIVIIDDLQDKMETNIITINGIKYRKILDKYLDEFKHIMRGKEICIPSHALDQDKYSRPTPTVDVVEEYTLIRNKQSKLSKWERDWVIMEFNKQYQKV